MRAHAPMRTAAAATVTAALALTGWLAGPAHAGTSSHPIHPGAGLTVSDNQCEVGFVLTDGHRVFAAVPASCTGTDQGTQADGCYEAQIPYDSRASVTGARHKARLVYSSFSTMQLYPKRAGAHACAANNLSVFQFAKSDARRVTPTVPQVGRPHRAARGAPSSGASLVAFLRSGRMSASAGSTNEGGWQHSVTIEGAVTASDMGAPIISPHGVALGMVTVLPAAPSVAGELMASKVSDLRRELRFLHGTHGFHHVRLMRAPLH
jgi:hypothetical protein